MTRSIARGAPVDAIAAVAGCIITGLAIARPELFRNIPPEQLAAAMAGVGSIGAVIRAAWRARRRRRRARRQARQEQRR